MLAFPFGQPRVPYLAAMILNAPEVNHLWLCSICILQRGNEILCSTTFFFFFFFFFFYNFRTQAATQYLSYELQLCLIQALYKWQLYSSIYCLARICCNYIRDTLWKFLFIFRIISSYWLNVQVGFLHQLHNWHHIFPNLPSALILSSTESCTKQHIGISYFEDNFSSNFIGRKSLFQYGI